MGQQQQRLLDAPLLGNGGNPIRTEWRRALWFLPALLAVIFAGLTLTGHLEFGVVRGERKYINNERIQYENGEVVESEQAVVAADDARCSQIGASILRQGGHAVDSAVATALCLGVVNAMASGIGGGGFMVVRSSATSQTQAFDMRETAPLASSQVYAPNGKLLKSGDRCFNVELGHSLEAIAKQGPEVFYGGAVGEKFVEDVREAGGILTMEDLRSYKVVVTEAVTVNAMGYTILGMPPPSSGTLGISLVLNILDSYGSSNAAKGSLGLHRLIEALKHMFALRMNLGDPNFVDISRTISDMLSPSFAKKIQQRIFDNTTFPPEYYMHRWSQLRDHGTSHFCVVDADRNAVSMTTTVNYAFGAKVLSASTGIVVNNEMDDFSTPTEISPDHLPPSPTNFIEPNKRPLSSMTPIIVLKDNQLVGVIGGSGGLYIIPAVLQVFLNHFILGMEPLAAVQSPRVYHKLIPNVVLYEDWTCLDGEHIELSTDIRQFLEERGHKLEARSGGAISQFIVQDLHHMISMGRKNGKAPKDQVLHGVLTAVSDPRKDGRPAAI